MMRAKTKGRHEWRVVGCDVAGQLMLALQLQSACVLGTFTNTRVTFFWHSNR